MSTSSPVDLIARASVVIERYIDEEAFKAHLEA
jgi:quinol monooxygenase YgiN